MAKSVAAVDRVDVFDATIAGSIDLENNHASGGLTHYSGQKCYLLCLLSPMSVDSDKDVRASAGS